MKLLLRWILPTVLLAAFLHFLLIWWAPELVTTLAFRSMQRLRPLGWNAFSHQPRLAEASDPSVPATSPDIVYSIAFYDLTSGPVRVHCVIPETGNYWSVSLYAWNTDNFFVENDRTAAAREFDLVLTLPGAVYHPRAGERVLTSPTTKGIILLRAIISDRENKKELALISAAQRNSAVVPVRPEAGH